MKPVVGLGTVTSLGTVIRLEVKKGVTVDNQGVKEVFSFQEFEEKVAKELIHELRSIK